MDKFWRMPPQKQAVVRGHVHAIIDVLLSQPDAADANADADAPSPGSPLDVDADAVWADADPVDADPVDVESEDANGTDVAWDSDVDDSPRQPTNKRKLPPQDSPDDSPHDKRARVDTVPASPRLDAALQRANTVDFVVPPDVPAGLRQEWSAFCQRRGNPPEPYAQLDPDAKRGLWALFVTDALRLDLCQRKDDQGQFVAGAFYLGGDPERLQQYVDRLASDAGVVAQPPLAPIAQDQPLPAPVDPPQPRVVADPSAESKQQGMRPAAQRNDMCQYLRHPYEDGCDLCRPDSATASGLPDIGQPADKDDQHEPEPDREEWSTPVWRRQTYNAVTWAQQQRDWTRLGFQAGRLAVLQKVRAGDVFCLYAAQQIVVLAMADGPGRSARPGEPELHPGTLFNGVYVPIRKCLVLKRPVALAELHKKWVELGGQAESTRVDKKTGQSRTQKYPLHLQLTRNAGSEVNSGREWRDIQRWILAVAV